MYKSDACIHFEFNFMFAADSESSPEFFMIEKGKDVEPHWELILVVSIGPERSCVNTLDVDWCTYSWYDIKLISSMNIVE